MFALFPCHVHGRIGRVPSDRGDHSRRGRGGHGHSGRFLLHFLHRRRREQCADVVAGGLSATGMLLLMTDRNICRFQPMTKTINNRNGYMYDLK